MLTGPNCMTTTPPDSGEPHHRQLSLSLHSSPGSSTLLSFLFPPPPQSSLTHGTPTSTVSHQVTSAHRNHRKTQNNRNRRMKRMKIELGYRYRKAVPQTSLSLSSSASSGTFKKKTELGYRYRKAIPLNIIIIISIGHFQNCHLKRFYSLIIGHCSVFKSFQSFSYILIVFLLICGCDVQAKITTRK